MSDIEITPQRHRHGRLRRMLHLGTVWGPERAWPGDPDLDLDLDAVTVVGVFVINGELLAQLAGGIGRRMDTRTGQLELLKAADVALSWRCSRRRDAERLCDQLNRWQALGTPLRLLAAEGRPALLMEDDDSWLPLPALKLTG